MSQYPWEKPANFKFKAMFRENETFSLNEADLLKGYYAFYALGNSVAAYHSRGIIMGDLHKKNWHYIPLNGALGFFDFSASRVLDKLNPFLMVEEFIAPFLDFTRQDFIAFLAGYVKYSYLLNDPIYPGFTDIILGLIGGQAIKTPKARENYLDPAKYLLSISASFEFDGKSAKLKDAEAAKVIDQFDNNTTDFVIFLFSLIFLGVDLSDLFSGNHAISPARSEQGKQWFRLFSDFYRRHTFQEIHIGDTGIQSICIAILRELQAMQSNAKSEFPNFSPVEMLPFIVRRLQIPQQDLTVFYDCLIDTSNYLSVLLEKKFVDTGNNDQYLRQSISLAQISYIILQTPPRSADTDESRYLNIFQNDLKLSWNSKVSAITNDLFTFMVETTYVHAKCNAARKIFVNSVESEQPMYSYSWVSIRAYREVITRLCNQMENFKTEIDIQNINYISRLILEGYFGSLRDHSLYSIRNADELYFDKHEIIRFKDIETLVELGQYLKNSGLETKMGLELLRKLVGLWE